MQLRKLDKRGESGVGQLPGFFQIMMLVVIFAGLTFIILDEFMTASYDKNTAGSVANESLVTVTETGENFAVVNYRDVSCTVSHVKNGTGLSIQTIPSTNYTVTGCTIAYKGGAGAPWNNTNWNVTYSYSWSADNLASDAINQTSNDLYDYAIGFLGIVILVVMVYLIISIVSGRKSGAK